MSKIIVDQIAKNGGTTFTLPSTDGGANAPLVTNGTGTLAYSPLKMPAADGTANKPITTDGSGQLQFNPNALPATIGSSGQQLAVNAGATALEYVATSPGVAFKKTLDFNTLSATNTHDITWSSINSAIVYSKIAGVRLSMYEISSTAAYHLYIYGLNAGGSVINSGYFGGSYRGRQNSGNMEGQEHNSSQGWMRFPNYGNSIRSTNYSYGFGMTGYIMFQPWREGTGDQLDRSGGSGYNIVWQHSSNTWPNVEHGGWNNYSNQQAPAAMEGGFRFFSTSGNFNHGRLVIEVQMEE
jgi:hypothetical protein